MSSGGPTFVSYLPDAQKDNTKDKKLAEALTRMYERPNKELENRLLEGEVAIGHAKKVIRYNVHDDPTRGISGTLVCTNFRLCLITAEKATYDLIELRNRLLNDHDILLNNIESIYIEYPNKRKRLVPGSKVKEGIHRLELHCKDFRVAAFNFKLTAKGEETNVIKAILHHAYPSTVNLLFAFDHKHNADLEKECKIPMYRNSPDWELELRRCNVPKKKWKISGMNRQFLEFETMGSHVVVPNSVPEAELSKAANQFNNGRVPTWCWTDSNGCSLVRAASLRPDTEHQHYETDIYTAIKDTDPKKRPLKVIDVSKSCPSCLQLQQSFNKLKALCMPANESDFWESDARWHSSLSSTKWLHHVSTTLATARQAAIWLREKDHNVIVKGTSGTDLSSVVTSLIQLMLDPTCRTMDGFQCLIQREWVVAGHPFLDRLGHLFQPKKNKQSSSIGEGPQLAPVFLLFLDCVWQMYLQFPARFESNATFLTVIYDTTRMTAFDTFIFNNERHRERSLAAKENPSSAIQEVDQPTTWQFLPAWAWNIQFNKTDMTLFNNPLYKLRTMGSYRKYVEETSMGNSYRKRLLSDEIFMKSELGEDGMNGDVPDGMAYPQTRIRVSFDVDKKSPKKGYKKKQTENEKRAEEHRRKWEKDNPLPLNKNKQKNTSRVTNQSEEVGKSGRIEENKNPRNDEKKLGHHPKVALMPKQHKVSQNKEEPEPVSNSTRSKSDSDTFEENAGNSTENSLEEDDVSGDLKDFPTYERASPKNRTRWSIRKKKPKEYFSSSEQETSCSDVPTYTVHMQDPVQMYDRELLMTGTPALYPCASIPRLQLWRPCYFRWLPWSQIFGGGPAAMLRQESMLYDEIHVLQNKIHILKQKLSKEDSVHHSGGFEDSLNLSGMFFNHSASQENLSVFEPNSNKTGSQTSLNFLSSYFPYSPIKDLRRKSIVGTPISNFLQGGSLFNFGRGRKHARSPSALSITHSLSHSIEDLSGSDNQKLSLSRSMEDLTSTPRTAPPSDLSKFYRTHSDVDHTIRERSQLVDRVVMKPPKSPSPTTPTENVTYITSL